MKGDYGMAFGFDRRNIQDKEPLSIPAPGAREKVHEEVFIALTKSHLDPDLAPMIWVLCFLHLIIHTVKKCFNRAKIGSMSRKASHMVMKVV
jgi:hypothetical protein